MEGLISIINQLQEVFSTVGGDLVELPQIVVVGCQSAGKSSVLEAIVGRDFLPRGAGIVTRRPLILQLEHVEAGSEEYGEFSHKKGTKFTSFTDMRKEIEDETDRTTGQTKNISDVPIVLHIKSSGVPTLTMVDLPGLTKVAIEGQDPRIVEMIHTMVLKFITQKNSLILAVSPANQDIANSDSLRIAREVDPSGERTIGVLTKVDLMDAGTDAGSILRNQIYPLKLGYIAVINRSQRDIDTGKSMKDAFAAEAKYFNEHPVYSNMTEHCGTKILISQLQRMLTQHIKNTLPAIRTRVTQLIVDKEQELAKYGEDPTKTRFNAPTLVMGVVNEYIQNFENLIQGKVGEQTVDDDLKGGARINRIFTTQFEKEIYAAPPIKKSDLGEITFLMRNHAGITVPIYTSHQAFESLIRRHIEVLRPPALEAVHLVASEILNIHSQVQFPALERYPMIKSQIRSMVEVLVDSCVEPTLKFVNDLIDNEKIFINTARHDFRGAAVLGEKFSKEAVPTKKTKKQIELENAKTLVSLAARYFELVRMQIVDIIPKAVVLQLVEGSFSKLKDTLLADMLNSSLIDEMTKEDPRITSNRKHCQEVLEALRKAQDILNKVRQTA